MAVAAAEIITVPPNSYVDLDTVPDVTSARQEVRNQAWNTIYQRRDQLNSSQSEYVPLPIDALSTAHTVLAVEQQYGTESADYKEVFAGLQLDCLRLLAEWYRKKKPEYFPATHHTYDPTTEDFYSHGLSIRQMTENALVPIKNDPEEEARRVNERVEDATPHILRSLGSVALSGVRIRTISECTDGAIKKYQADQKRATPVHGGYNGYVPEIKKLMVRDISLDEVSGDRYEEQVGLPGIYIEHEIIQEALRRRQVIAKHKDKTALHGMQLLANDKLIDFVQLLDDVASEQWCTNIFMGEQVPEDHPKDYTHVETEARERQAGFENQSRAIALFVKELAANHTDPREAPAFVEEFVKRVLVSMVGGNVELAAQVFDEKTAQGLQQVHDLEHAGRLQEADELQRQVIENAPGGGYCGAGSCGLEAVILGSKEASDLEELGFDPKSSIKDTVRSCPDCKTKTVYYEIKQGLKGCTRCKKTTEY